MCKAINIKTVKKEPPESEYFGPLIKCPKCGRILMEATLDSLKTRCRKCGWWIVIKPENGKAI